MKYFLIALLLVSSQVAFGQEEDPIADQIFLNDGSILFGKIIFSVDKTVKLHLTTTNGTMSIDRENI